MAARKDLYHKKRVKDLAAALGLGTREHISLVGGGGKTALMFALARELRQKRAKVVTATTTRVWYREALRSPMVLLLRAATHWENKLKEGLDTHGHIFVGGRVLESNKVEGISPAMADRLFRTAFIDYLIVEADGSAGHPVKAPAVHEPVIPSSSTTVVALMGLEALGNPPGPGLVFRQALFEKVTGLSAGEKLTPHVLSRLFHAPSGSFKGALTSGKRVAFLNKADLLADKEEGKHLSRLILDSPKGWVDRVVMGSVLTGNYEIIEKRS